ncbi:DUF4336 domain-containing protein [Citreimonas sp.]|uniref:DUF4336 domain-containing protein n=1 Tax=Citreimonas sp. TaxID=3036715 RepID=UPI0035C7C431
MANDAEQGYPPFDMPKPVAENLWIVDARPIRAFGIPLPVRMTVVRLASGDLWLHSPTRFAPALLQELERLGPIRHLIAPNIGHWTFLADWQRNCPDATTWAAPNLRRRPRIRLSSIRTDRDLGKRPPPDWQHDLDQRIIAGAGFQEVAFLHRESRSLILTDLVMNLEPDRMPARSRLYAALSGTTAPEGGTPRYLRLPLRLGRRKAVEAATALIDWQPDRVIFAHGRWFANDGAAKLRKAFRWLVGPSGE